MNDGMRWNSLDSGEFKGLETFLSDGTAIDIVEYGGSGDWCWMIRVPVEDDFTTHEVYASYDDDTYFDDMCSALDAAMEYLGRFFPEHVVESRRYEQARWSEKISILKAAAAIGLVAVFSASISFGLPADAYAAEGFEPAAIVEPAGVHAQDEIVFGYDVSGQPAYKIGPTVETVLRSAGLDARQPDHIGQAIVDGDLLVLSANDGTEAFARIPEHLRESVYSLLPHDNVEFRAYELDSSEAQAVAGSVKGSVFDFFRDNQFSLIILVILSPFVCMFLKQELERRNVPTTPSQFRRRSAKKRQDEEDKSTGYYQAHQSIDRLSGFAWQMRNEQWGPIAVERQLKEVKELHHSLIKELSERFRPTTITYDRYATSVETAYATVIANCQEYADIAKEVANGNLMKDYNDTPLPGIAQANENLVQEMRTLLNDLIDSGIDWRSEGTNEVSEVLGVLSNQLDRYEVAR